MFEFALLPPLPMLQDANINLMLDVYTHHSLRIPGQPMQKSYGDTLRLRDLGEKALDLAVTDVLFAQQEPMKRAEEIEVSITYSLKVFPGLKISEILIETKKGNIIIQKYQWLGE